MCAVQMVADLFPSKKEGGIVMALQHVVSAHWKGFIGALKCMYFLNQKKLHIQQLLCLLERYFGNAHYTSEHYMQELLQCLGETDNRHFPTNSFAVS